MQKRRTVLTTIGTVGTVAIAGCSDTSESEPEPEEEEETQEESEPEEESEESESEEEEQVEEVSTFLLSDLSIESETIETGTDIEFSVKIENRGNVEDTQEITTELDSEIVDSEEYTIEPSGEKTHSHNIDTTDLEPNGYDLVVASDDDSETGTITIESVENYSQHAENIQEYFGGDLIAPDVRYTGSNIQVDYVTGGGSTTELAVEISLVIGGYTAEIAEENMEPIRLEASVIDDGETVAEYYIEEEWGEKYKNGEYTVSDITDKVIENLEVIE